MGFWRLLYAAIVVLLLIILAPMVKDIQYLDFVLGIFGISAFELYRYLIENKKI
jgi:hypothetical protein